MRTGFGLRIAVGMDAGDFDCRVLDARFIAVGGIKNFGVESLAACPFDIHPDKHLRPVLRVDAAFAGVDDQDRIRAVMGTGERQI